MRDNHNSIAAAGIATRVAEPVEHLCNELAARLGDDLRSVTIVGSSLTDQYRPGLSDINTVVVVRQETLAALETIASLAKAMRGKRLSPPIVMTASYIERSRDVFGIEFLDFQLVHQTVLGEDPFAALTFDKERVRLQCERELKAALVRLRQGYIGSAGSSRLIRDILIAAARSLAPLLRAMLWLKDLPRPTAAGDTFNKAGSEFGVKLDAAATAAGWRYEKMRLKDADLDRTFEAVYTTVDRLAVIIDEMEV